MDSKNLHNWSAEEKVKNVKRMFKEINPNYDLLNHILSAWQDVRWRNFVVKRLPKDTVRILDVCTGTGDVAIKLAEKRKGARITALDFVPEMMGVARKKSLSRGFNERIDFLQGDALYLPFPDNHFDAVTVAFGFRNITDRLTALKEMKRVVKLGGKILVLEMTLPRSGLSQKFFKFYLENVVPRIGGTISGKKDAYNYLSNSIEDFFTPSQLTEYFNRAGIDGVKEFPLTFGITYLHEGTV